MKENYTIALAKVYDIVDRSYRRDQPGLILDVEAATLFLRHITFVDDITRDIVVESWVSTQSTHGHDSESGKNPFSVYHLAFMLTLVSSDRLYHNCLTPVSLALLGYI